MLALTIPGQAFASFYSYFYVEKLGLAVGLATLARSIYLVWDALNDPLLGYLSDATRTRWGRRRPWIVASMPLFMLFFVAVFIPPETLKGNGLFVWLVVTLVLFETVAAIQWVNYGALFPELYRGEQQRASASAVQQGYQILALIVGTSLTPIIFAALGFLNMALIFAAAYGLLMVACVALVRENPEAQRTKPLGPLHAFRETLSNRPFWVFCIANSFAQTVNGLLGSMIPFYAKYALRIPEAQVSVLLAVIFASVIPLIPLWAWVVRRFGAKRAWQTAMAIYGLSVIPLGFAQGLMGGIVAGILVGFGLAGFLVTPPVLGAYIIDQDALRTGRRREGIYGAVGGFITRSSGFLGIAAFWLVGLQYGYQSGDQPGPNPEGAFRFLMSAIPLGLLGLAFATTFLMKVDKRGAGP
jgi:GPH family glycoside/pentoside/hexuronide:cation symporter